MSRRGRAAQGGGRVVAGAGVIRACDGNRRLPGRAHDRGFCGRALGHGDASARCCASLELRALPIRGDRKSTRLNSSHLVISYAVFCLKKKKKNNNRHASSSIA